jgi:uncharacterized protein YidB (DUF937 family)
MSIFFDLLSAINNPNQQASVGQLETLTNSIGQLTSRIGLQPEQMQSIFSTVGQVLQPVLKNQQSGLGGGLLENVIGQVANSGGSAAALQNLLPPQVQQQIVQTIAQKVGLDANMVQSVLPTLLPMVMNFFQMGAGKPGTSGPNPLLASFLDSDGDGDTDLGDMLKFAGRFLQPAT